MNPAKTLITEVEEVVAGGCHTHPMARTIPISAKEEDKRRNKAEVRSKEKTQIAAKTDKNVRDKLKSGTVVKEDVQLTAENREQKTLKKRDEPYPVISAFPKTGELSAFKNEKYKLSVPIGFNSFCMHSIACVFDTCTGPSHI